MTVEPVEQAGSVWPALAVGFVVSSLATFASILVVLFGQGFVVDQGGYVFLLLPGIVGTCAVVAALIALGAMLLCVVALRIPPVRRRIRGVGSIAVALLAIGAVQIALVAIPLVDRWSAARWVLEIAGTACIAIGEMAAPLSTRALTTRTPAAPPPPTRP